MDIYSFLADYIANEKGLKKEDASDSYSFKKAVLEPNKFYERAPLIHRDARGRKVVRFGHWKYVEGIKNKKKINAEMLFDLSKDSKETNNLANLDLEIVAKAKEHLIKVNEKQSKTIWK